jgi:hypothetical protein
MIRGAFEIETAQMAADAVTADIDAQEQWKMLLDLGVDYEGARQQAQLVAADLYSRISEQVINGPRSWRHTLEVQLQASWLAGCVVGSHLEGPVHDDTLFGYEQLRDGAEQVKGYDHPDAGAAVMRELALDGDAARDAATYIGIALVEVLKNEGSFSEDEEIAFGSALAAAWFEGLIIVVHVRRQLA